MNLFGSERNYTKTLIRDLKEQNKRLKKELTDLTGKVYSGATVLDEVTKRNVPLNLESPSASPGAVPIQTTVPQVSSASIIDPTGEIQLSRIAQAQQYRDMLDANRRFSEDDFRIRELLNTKFDRETLVELLQIQKFDLDEIFSNVSI